MYQALLFVLVGIPLYGFLKVRRERLGRIEETVDMPSELADAPPQQGEHVEAREGTAPCSREPH